MKLYGFPGSPNTWKVRALAEHIGVPLELQIVDLTKGAQKSPDYLAINPTGRTPSLVDGELNLFESTAIMQYIAAKAKSDLWPADDAIRARIMQWQSWQLQHWAAACEPLLRERVVKAFFNLGPPDQAVIAKAEEAFRNEARVLDAHLAKHAHLVADRLTIADFSVASYLFLAERAQMPLAEFKNVGRWFKSVASLPAWARTAPQMSEAAMTFRDVVSREAWLEQRMALLAKEKAFTKARDALAAERRALPRVAVTEDYRFDTEHGVATLGDLFEGRSQLVVYHFMFGPDWKQGCKSCSFWADTFASVGPHLAARDVTLCAVSRAPLATLQKFKARMGWTFPWASSAPSTFNFDFGVSFRPDDVKSGVARYNYATRSAPREEAPGISVFLRDAAGSVFHTYSTYGRGLDPLNSAYQILDLVPKGRDEASFDWPMQWVRFRDEYGMPGA